MFLIASALEKKNLTNREQNPTIVRHNASPAKNYNASSSLVRLENKNMNSSSLKNALAYYSAGVVVVILKLQLSQILANWPFPNVVNMKGKSLEEF
jgi:hypothetical protein